MGVTEENITNAHGKEIAIKRPIQEHLESRITLTVEKMI